MPIIMPVSSGSSGPWTDNDTKVWISIYLALAVLWILQVLYSVIFNKLTLKEALTTENNDYFLVEVSNVLFYCITVLALIAVIGVAIYNLL
jgi:small-conductance mechanosensitive channel